jgi:hypothetical protein
MRAYGFAMGNNLAPNSVHAKFWWNFQFQAMPHQALLHMNHENARSAFPWLYEKLKYLGNY